MSTTLIKVPFHGGHVLVAQDADGERIVVKTVCDRLSMDAQAQQRRCQREPRLRAWTAKMAVRLPGDEKTRHVVTIPRKKLAAFLYGIQPGMVKDPETRANLIALQDELEDAMDAYFGARVAGASKEDVLRAIEEATAPLVARIDAQAADLREERSQRADMLAMLRGRLSAPCGRAEKRALTALASEVAALTLEAELRAPIAIDARRAPAFKQRLGDVLEEAAQATRTAGRALDLLTVDEAARLTCHLEHRKRKLQRRLRRRTTKTIARRPRQLKLVS